MATLDPHEVHEQMTSTIKDALASVFPVKGRTTTLQLKSVEVGKLPDPEDVEAQYDCKINGKSWTTPVHGQMELVDNATGKVLIRQKVRLMDLPTMTKRFSYIFNGQEYQVANQWQLKPGVYARRQENGELEARFNVVNRAAFKMLMDPATGKFTINYKKANLPAYPILSAMGISDAEMEKVWGTEIFKANKESKRQSGALAQFYRTSTNGKEPPQNEEELKRHLHQVMSESVVRPEVVKETLGHETDRVDGRLLFQASSKLIKVHNGAPEDDRDSLVFKTLRSTGDYLKDHLQQSSRAMATKMQIQMNKGDLKSISQALRPGMFNDSVRKMFQSSLVNPAKQINPLDMVGTAMQTTIMGPGGIKSDVQVTDAAKMINPSQAAIIDPLVTPEGGATGISLRLPIGVKRIGDQPHIPVWDVKQKKTVYVDPKMFMSKKVVLADQVEFVNGVPKPLSKEVKALGEGNEPILIPFHEADFILKSPSQVYSITTNLVPFLQNNSGGRISMATRHMEQSISLADRDQPLVQVKTPGNTNIKTFEQLVGYQTTSIAPTGGKVISVTSKEITIQDNKGRKHTVKLYDHYPLNDTKSVLHSTPLVKPGDVVNPGDVLADNNYTKNGVLALGKNLRTAYMSYHGLNFEDGIVITESAAKKLSSIHLHKNTLPIPEVNNQLQFDVKKFQAAHPLLYTKDQYKSIDPATGTVKVGTRVKPGDPLVIALQPFQLKDRTGIAAIRKGLTNQLLDKSLKWEGETEGEVVAVHHTPTGVHVHVKTIEPMKVGDKLSHRTGGKGICTLILPDDQAPRDAQGRPVEVLFQPGGLGGRMNVGQLLEAAAGKIAQKTGKPYIVENFDPKIKDWTQHIKNELQKHNLSDTEELFDPKTGLSYGKVFTGPIYFLKLVHQIDKKESMRSGMGLPRLQNTEKYDATTLTPASGGGTGGQSLGQLGMYALLAHGAKGILREAMTYKSEGEDPETNEAKRWKSQHNEVWRAIQTGAPIPPPKPTFAFHRFTELIKGAGINLEKKGDQFYLSPLTDKHILSMSKGVIQDPSVAVQAKRDESGMFRPIPGGLFDEKVAGGHGGTNWSHVPLAEPIPNPVFEEPIKKLLGLTETKYHDLLQGKISIHPSTLEIQNNSSGLVGGYAFKALLKRIDVKKELEATKQALDKAKPNDVNPLYKKARYLKALDQLGIRPEEAYILHNLPILPPKIRPLTGMDDGALHYEGINGLYIKFGQINKALANPITKKLPPSELASARANLYDSVAAVFGTGVLPEGAKDKGILHMIAGTSPKMGVFQKGLLSRRQDMSARATIIPEPKLTLDEMGIPRAMAMTIFRPKLVRQLVVQGSAKDELAAQQMLSEVEKGKDDPQVNSALENLTKTELIIAKRDPALWKYSIQAFKPRIVEGKAIRIHPLVTGGFNADFDGDSCLGSVFVLSGTKASVVDLEFFPRIPESRQVTCSGVETYSVPSDTFVLGSLDGEMGAYRVTEYSIHPDCEEWEVHTATTVIRCSSDHSLMLFDPNTLLPVSSSPRSSEGRFVPVQGLLPGHTHTLVSWKGAELEATEVLGEKIGKELRHFTVEDRIEFLLKSLFLPIGFRKGVLRSYLMEYFVRSIGQVACWSESLKPMASLLRSVGVMTQIREGALYVDGLDLENTDLVPKKRKGGAPPQLFTPIPLPDWVLEEIPPFLYVRNPTRPWAREHRKAILENSPSPYVRRWLDLVTGSSLFWDPVLRAIPTGRTCTMYDLTVTDAMTFALDSGHVVWDTMSVYSLISEEAKRDARKMLPSNNIFSESTGQVAYTPSMESLLGIHRLSLIGPATNQSFGTAQEAIKALGHKKVQLNDQIRVGGILTTPGRVLLSTAVPEPLKIKVMTDFNMELNKKGVNQLFTEVGKNYKDHFVAFADKIKDLGYDASTGIINTPLHPTGKVSVGAHSFKLDDFLADKKSRDPILAKADAEAAVIRAKNLPKHEKDRQIAEVYLKADKEIQKIHQDSRRWIGNNLKAMTDAGMKPSKDQYKQMTLAPMVMTDSKGRLIPLPITRSYGEGLDMMGYSVAAIGARSGTVKKVQEVQEPGYMTKLLQNVSMDKLIDMHDCGTHRGLKVSVMDYDIVDRHLASPLKVGGISLPAGALLTKDILDKIRKADPNAELHVRSPLHCHSGKGVCQKCYGLDANGKPPELGTNIGVLSAHALGERAVQLTLKAFHQAGVATAGGGALGAFGRLEQLTYLPDKIPNAATHATVQGKIEKIETTPTGTNIWIAGKPHFVGKDAYGNPLHIKQEGVFHTKKWEAPKVGMEVKPGQFLSDPNRTVINPHRYFEATKSMDKTQEMMAKEIHSIYADEGVRKRAVEVVVRSMGNLSEVEHPGDHPDFLKGQTYSKSEIERANRELIAQGKKPIRHKPILRGVNLIPLQQTEDWMARLNHQKLRSTLMEGAAQNWKSDLHGPHPIPGLAYGAEFGKPPFDPKNKIRPFDY